MATHRYLYVFDLTTDPDLENPTRIELERNEQRPVKLQLVEDFFGENGKFVVYLSYLGELVVREIGVAGMPSVAEMSNPGFATFVVGPERPSSRDSLEIYAGGLQRQVFRLVFRAPIHGPPSTKVEIVGASPEVGIVRDLVWEETMWGSDHLLAHVGGAGTIPEGIVRFKSTSPSVLSVASSVAQPAAGDLLRLRGLGSGSVKIVSLSNLDLHALLVNGTVYLMPGDLLNEFLGGTMSEFPYQTDLFPAAAHVVGIASGDLDADSSPDLVLATQNGQVAWIPGGLLLTGDLSSIESTVLGAEWYGSGNPAVPESYSSGSISATWGMTRLRAGPTGEPEIGPIQVVDQCARRWEIDPATGRRTYLHVVTATNDSPLPPAPGVDIVAFPAPKPFRDLAFVGEEPPATDVTDVYARRDAGFRSGVPGIRWALWTFYDVAVAPGTGVPVTPDSGFVDYLKTLPCQLYDEGYLPFSFGGDLRRIGEASYAYYWTGNRPILGPEAHDVVRGVIHDGQPGVPFDVWGSSTNIWPQSGSYLAHMRNAVYQGTPQDAQSLRLGMWGQAAEDLRIIVGTAGGGLMALDPAQGPTGCLVDDGDARLHDHGFGGIALCVEEVSGTGAPTIFFGTLHARLGAGAGGDLVSSLHVYELTNDVLVAGEATVFDGVPQGEPKLFGLCGLAVGNLVDDGDGVQAELVLTTLNGDLVVYDLDPAPGSPGGVTLGPLLHHQVYDGALGASNSILIDETLPRTIFVAGSMGMRKFTVTP